MYICGHQNSCTKTALIICCCVLCCWIFQCDLNVKVKDLLGHLELIGKKKNARIVLVGKPEEKSSLKRSGRTWKGNIKVDLNEIG